MFLNTKVLCVLMYILHCLNCIPYSFALMLRKLLLFHKLSVWCNCFLWKVKFKIFDTGILFSCWFKKIERVAFFLQYIILFLKVCVKSITESFGALLKVRLSPSSPKISIRAISDLAFMTLSHAVVTKQRMSGRRHLKRFYWLCDIPHKLWVR